VANFFSEINRFGGIDKRKLCKFRQPAMPISMPKEKLGERKENAIQMLIDLMKAGALSKWWVELLGVRPASFRPSGHLFSNYAATQAPIMQPLAKCRI
jgi:hypothetical protein